MMNIYEASKIVLCGLLIQGSVMATPFSFQFPESVNQLVVQSPCYIKSNDGIDLAYYKFVPLNPDAILVFYHGAGAWSNKIYQYMAKSLSENHNIGVYLFDIRGHGNSSGPRGDTSSAEDVWHDVSAAIDFASLEYPSTPIFLGGHSSGAGLVLNYSDWSQHRSVSGYLFLSPFLGGQSETAYDHVNLENKFIKNVRLIPLIIHAITYGFFFAHTPVIFFNYPESEKRKDSFLLEHYTSTMAQATSPYDAKKSFAQIDRPCSVLIGELDEQFIPEKVIGFNQYLTNSSNNSLFQIIPQVRHLSLVLESPSIISEWIGKVLNID